MKEIEPKVEANKIALVGVEIPEGYELADAVMRFPQIGEFFLSCDKGVRPLQCGSIGIGMRIIVKKKWEWPEWLIAKYIAMNRNGVWNAFMDHPYIHAESETWCIRNNGYIAGIIRLNPNVFTIELPTCSDWTKSLIENPNAE
jgi:hypothetical protein